MKIFLSGQGVQTSPVLPIYLSVIDPDVVYDGAGPIIDHTVEVHNGKVMVNLDLDINGNLVGIEIV